MSTGLQNPEIARRFSELYPPLTSQEAMVEANRCLFCFDAPCALACPTHIDVPRFIKKIGTGNLLGSALTILEANILGASCARVCPVEVLCEGACVMVRFNKQPIRIGRLQRHATESFLDSAHTIPRAEGDRTAASEPRGRVACIGAGPASLSAAAELQRRGYQATVFESRALPGGLNTYGVAEYKLRAVDSVRETEIVRSLGVEFRYGVEIGSGIPLDQLEREYDAIFIGAGLGQMEPLGVPGDDLPHVVDALQFIADYKTQQSIAVQGRVIVIGGGNTAVDAACAAKRLGASEVHVLYRRSAREIPAFQWEYEHALREGVLFHWQVQPVAIREREIEMVRVELGVPDATGRRTPVPVEGSSFTMEADLVIPAIGQSRFEALLGGVPGLELRGGNLVVDRATGQTGNPNYFAGGDCVNGGREVVDAVADGKRAAHGIIRMLESRHG